MDTPATPAAPSDVRQHILDVARPLLLARGYTAVGLAEVLAAAKVPKGSFYHYFASKDAFGVALLEDYFKGYLAYMDGLMAGPGNGRERLVRYFHEWRETQGCESPHSRCLVVKLGAEVCDLSDPMRTVLQAGTRAITERIERGIEAGRADGSLPPAPGGLAPAILAANLYEHWLGASLLAKIMRSRQPLDTAMAGSLHALGVADDE
ncbi:TetR/AcrR family transcriptional regulator [Achromobacter xylosoxidans]|uniref:TetR/AcrR family transcriptional regulator n=1 Tax=Achromobacter TaxID=222 RepID=UPI0011DD45B8|nr:TetR/AcrR family transcriptional regulator [Achromobacter xylosoxidans]